MAVVEPSPANTTGAIAPMSPAKIVATIDSLPTLPIVALQLGELVHGRNVTVQQVADLLRSDPATSAKLLRLVNSAYFGIPGGVNDISRAIPFIGFNTMYQLVLSLSVMEALDTRRSDLRELWLHSLAVGALARELAVDIKQPEPGACFTAGLLHDMGTIALAKLDPAAFAASRKDAREGRMSLVEAEEHHGLPPHDQVGGLLAKAWRFPATLAVPIVSHHEIHRPQVRARLTPSLRQMTEMIAVADHLADDCSATFGAGSCGVGAEDEEMLELYERLGFVASQREQLLDRARRQLERSRIFLAVLG